MISEIDRHFPVLSLWSLFWSIYFISSVISSVRRTRFSQNYTEAWRKNHPNYAISVFFDRSSCVRIPCPDPDDPAVDDAWFWNHLSFFYRISRMEGDLIPVLLPRSLVRLEIVKVSSLLSSQASMRIQEQSSLPSEARGWTFTTRGPHTFLGNLIIITYS